MKETTQEELRNFVGREVIGLASDIVDRLREKDEDFFQIELDAMMPVKNIQVVCKGKLVWEEVSEEEADKLLEKYQEKIADLEDEEDSDEKRIQLYRDAVNSIEDAEPTYPEIFEYWFVTDWFAEKLKEKRETIIDEFALKIWGRTCTGQAIYLDSIIEEIYRELHKD